MDFACGKILMSPIDVSIDIGQNILKFTSHALDHQIAPVLLEEEEA
jgi:hypothetical protein